MRTRFMTVATVALSALLLAGCADVPGGDAGAPPDPLGEAVTPFETPTPSVGPSPGDSLPAVPLAPPRTESPVTAGEITVTGEIVEGVEAGCLLLHSDVGEFLLIFSRDVDRDALRSGTVRARGQVEPDMITTCQQGTPFVVSEISPA